MEKSESFYEFWSVRVPHSLPLPETSIFDNLRVSASRYPGKAAIVYYGTKLSHRHLSAEVNTLAGTRRGR